MLIVGAFLSSKKKKKPSEQEESKPVTAQQGHPGGPVNKLKEMYKEMQQEMEQETARQQAAGQSRQNPAPPRVEVELPPKPVVASVSPKKVARDSSRGGSRQSTRRQSTRVVKAQQNKLQVESILPKNKDDMIKGVIFSEIFGPPKSKR